MDAAAPAPAVDQNVVDPGEDAGVPGEDHDGGLGHDVRDAGGAAAGGQGNHADAGLHESPCITCEICGQHFKSKKQLNNHKPTHKSVFCKHCGNTFKGSTRLKDHKLRCLKQDPQYGTK